MPTELQVGQVWVSEETGNRWEIRAITLGSKPGEGKVTVQRLPRKGEERIPKWDDGVFVFDPTQFGANVRTRLEGSPRLRDCPSCQDRPGFDGLGRECKTCKGKGIVVGGTW